MIEDDSEKSKNEVKTLKIHSSAILSLTFGFTANTWREFGKQKNGKIERKEEK